MALSYDEFFDQYSKSIFKIIHVFVRASNMAIRHDEIDDIFQDIAFKIVKHDHISRYDKDKSSFMTWLSIICRTTAIDYYRRKVRWQTGEWGGEPEPGTAREGEPLPLSLPPGVLTPRQAEVVSLFFGEDMEAGEIADRLGISPRTVRSIKFQALERLRRHYATAADRAIGRSAGETRRTVS